MATECAHAGQRPCYAKGKCQSCYINDYKKQRRRENKLEKKEAAKIMTALTPSPSQPLALDENDGAKTASVVTIPVPV